MKAEFTAIIKKVGNSHVVFIPKTQMQVMRAEEGDAVRIIMETDERI